MSTWAFGSRVTPRREQHEVVNAHRGFHKTVLSCSRVTLIYSRIGRYERYVAQHHSDHADLGPLPAVRPDGPGGARRSAAPTAKCRAAGGPIFATPCVLAHPNEWDPPGWRSGAPRRSRPVRAPKILRRFRDFARKRWPCGQHKIAVWRVAPTAAPRIPRVHLPMAVPFGLGPRRGICLYHRRCGAISFRQTRAPFGPHSDEDLRW